MPPALLGSQFAALEPLEADEAGLVVDVERPPEEVLKALLAGIARL
jgi:gluconate kinase